MMWLLMRVMGLGGVIRAARQPHDTAFVANRKGSVLPFYCRARTLNAPDLNVVGRFHADRDQFEMRHLDLQRYGFRPARFEKLSPFRFVYLHPDDI